jgi:hypothetical protein
MFGPVSGERLIFERTTGDEPVTFGWVNANPSGAFGTWIGGIRGEYLTVIPVTHMFNKSAYSTGAMNIESSRTMQFNISPQFNVWCTTYHSMTFDFTGDVTGSGGGTVTVYLYRADTGERIGTTSRTGNGSYTITCYDNVTTLFAEAREGASYLGRSDNGTAS